MDTKKLSSLRILSFFRLVIRPISGLSSSFVGKSLQGYRFPKKFAFASRIAVGLVFLSFLLGVEPTFSYPPFRQSIVKAQTQTQEQIVVGQAQPIVFQLPHPGYISTYFSSYHPALDIATGLGMPIHPIADGTVVQTGFNFWGLGLTVTVDHDYGYKSLYAHMGKIYVKEGQKITKGEMLGEVGLTGNTSGPHTHLEVSKDGVNINPQPLLPSMEDLSQVYKDNGAQLTLKK